MVGTIREHVLPCVDVRRTSFYIEMWQARKSSRYLDYASIAGMQAAVFAHVLSQDESTTGQMYKYNTKIRSVVSLDLVRHSNISKFPRPPSVHLPLDQSTYLRLLYATPTLHVLPIRLVPVEALG